MEQFRDKFIEDANELLADLEKDLLALETRPDDSNSIEQVFRVMHTLKGVSSMYGFENIGELTHDLENIYDLVRDKLISIDTEILNLTLQSVDHIRNLLTTQGSPSADITAKHNEMIEKVKKIIHSKKKTDPDQQNNKPTEEEDNGDNIKTYYIVFRPKFDLFRRGVNPLSILDELYTLGQVKIIALTYPIPNLHKLDPSRCYVIWEIFLATKQSMHIIDDVFLFVPDEVSIVKLQNSNLFDQDSFVEKILDYSRLQENIDLIELKQFTASLKNKKEKNQQNIESEKTEIEKKEIKTETKTKKQETAGDDKMDFSDQKITSIRVTSEKLDELMNLVSELVTTQAELSLLCEKLASPQLQNITENIEKLSRRLRENAFSISLIPVKTMLLRFQRLVRDLSTELDKKVEFITEGTETELDKTIIDNLQNPLLHILRNSIDHGIETPEERIQKGKNPVGTLRFKAFYSGASVYIQISDDGAGIDKNKVKQKAIEKGLINKNAVLNDKEIYDLLFLPGFSTAQKITEVSGRGVGMDVVKKRINNLSGEVQIESKLNEGTIITIKLPLTLSIVDALLVQISETKYLIPISNIEYCGDIDINQIEGSFNNQISFDGQLLPFFHLRNEFDIELEEGMQEKLVIVNYEKNRVALVVDSIVGEHQAVLKSLGEVFKNHEVISGASILGDGDVALVMDPNRLIKQLSDKHKHTNHLV